MTGAWTTGDLLSSTNLNSKGGGNFPDRIYNAGWARFGSTSFAKEVRIQAAITAAVADGIPVVFVPASMLPYDASAVTFNSTVHMVREGGNPSVYEIDILAYGATGNAIVDDAPAFTAAFARAAALFYNAPVILAPRFYLWSSGITVGNITMKAGALTGEASNPRAEISGTIAGPLLTIAGTGGGSGANGILLDSISFHNFSTAAGASCVTLSGAEAPSRITGCTFISGQSGLLTTSNIWGLDITSCAFIGSLTVGGCGLYVVGNTTVSACDFTQWDIGILHGANGGTTFNSIRCEVCRTGILLGQDLAGNATLVEQTFLSGLNFEANDTHIYLRDVSQCTIAGAILHSSINSPSGGAIYGLRFGGGSQSVIGPVTISSLGGLTSFSGGGIYIQENQSFLTLIGCSVSTAFSTNGWVLSSNIQGVRLINCNGPGISAPFSSGATPSAQTAITGGSGTHIQSGTSAVTDILDGELNQPVTFHVQTGGTSFVHDPTKIVMRGGKTRFLATNEFITFMKTYAGGPWFEISTTSKPTDVIQTPSEAVLVSGVELLSGNLAITTLTAARVIGAPLHGSVGDTLTYTLIQGGVGGFAVTWNAVFKGLTWSDAGNATGKQSSIAFKFDGTNWNQVGAQSPYAT